MKKIRLNTTAIFAYCILITANCFSQGTAINTNGAKADSSAMLDVSSTSKGLLVPRMTETQKNNISSPAVSLLIYQTDGADPGYYYWDGSQWNKLTTGTGGSGTGWLLPGNAGTTPGADFLGTTDAKDLVIKTKNTEQVRIDTAGNVGIGNDTAYTKLVVNGGFSTSPAPMVNVTTNNTNINAGNYSYIKLTSTLTNPATSIITLSDGLQEGQHLILYNSSSPNYFVRINNSGNVMLLRSVLDIPGGLSGSFFWNGNKWVETGRCPVLSTNKQVFSATGSNQFFTVPEGIYALNIKLWGAGGQTAPNGTYTGNGGAGAYIYGTMVVVPGTKLTLTVGKSSGFGGGGGGSKTGGGRTAIQISSGTDVIAAGGGGAGGWSSGAQAHGGGAGAEGSNASNGKGDNPGYGASPTSGGAKGGGCATDGAIRQGGNACNCSVGQGGGGGGGWYGGGGGYCSEFRGGGGGGGSTGYDASYVYLISSEGGQTSSGVQPPPALAGGQSDPDYVSGVGNTGSDGYIVIYY